MGGGVGKREFDDWVHAHTADLLRYTKARVREEAIAEDLVQLAFIAAWEGREKFAQQSSPRTWLFSILKNKMPTIGAKAYRDPVVHGLEPMDADFFAGDGHWAWGTSPGMGPRRTGIRMNNSSASSRIASSNCLSIGALRWK
ncbi:MAG: hypothetical protein IPO60_08265 [Flavobacteriales bacterium]|nr:hypothetical protein [Flavobacteriales bacterium]